MNPNRTIVQSFNPLAYKVLTTKQRKKLKRKGVKIREPLTWLQPPQRPHFRSKLEEYQNEHDSAIEPSAKLPAAVTADVKPTE